MKRAHPISVVVLSLGVWLAGQARADSATPPCLGEGCTVAAANRCAAGKVEASGTYMEDVLGCYALSGLGGSAGNELPAAGRAQAGGHVRCPRTPGSLQDERRRSTRRPTGSTAECRRARRDARQSPAHRCARPISSPSWATTPIDSTAAMPRRWSKAPGTRWTPSVSRRRHERFLWDFTRPGQLCPTGDADGPAIDASIRAAVSGNRSAIAMAGDDVCAAWK